MSDVETVCGGDGEVNCWCPVGDPKVETLCGCICVQCRHTAKCCLGIYCNTGKDNGVLDNRKGASHAR